MIIRAVTRVCGFSCLFLERPARAMDPEKESWKTCMKMSPPLESQRPSCVRSVFFISTYAFIHTSKWSHSGNVSFCTWILEFFCFVFWGEVCHVTYTLASALWSCFILSRCEEHEHVCGSSPVYFAGLKLYYRQRQTSFSHCAWRIFRPHLQPVCSHLTGGNRPQHVKDTVLSPKWTTRLSFHQSL